MPVRRADNPSDAVEFARRLRRQMSVPERILWKLLRNRRLHGLKFRRQVPVGPYTADFYCAEVSLIVELDGDSHRDDRWRRDRVRDAWMQAQGLHILRVSVGSLMRYQEGVLQTIVQHAERYREGPGTLGANRSAENRAAASP